jgi:hypothetical protein
MNSHQPSGLLKVGVLFFGTAGLGFFAHGVYRFFARGQNYWLLLVAGLGLALFFFCLLVKREVLREK